mmetsp:Transcript_11447/g.26882  ORF Transcript_11447/g.26882 Transcript_11447/m.26882 type:complete len:105 (+) Transcript_11447:62-376(+)
MQMEPDSAVEEKNKILAEAALRVNQRADQRRLCNRRMTKVHHDFRHDFPHDRRRYCLVVDYCQNSQTRGDAMHDAIDSSYSRGIQLCTRMWQSECFRLPRGDGK